MNHVDAYRLLGQYRSRPTRQEIKTLRGQILAGQSEAAMKGLRKCLSRHGIKGGDAIAPQTKAPMPSTGMRQPIG